MLRAGSIGTLILGTVALGACELSVAEMTARYNALPREIRRDGAEMVVQPVDTSVPEAEVVVAVQALLEREPLCFAWPSLWLTDSERRTYYYARYDLMARDWGAELAAESRRRMQEFVDMGFLTATDRPNLGPGAVEYVLTPDGDTYLRGSPYGTERPQFCAPSQRHLVQIDSSEWGEFGCGNLRVTFQHRADEWPSWARTERSRELVTATWGGLGAIAPGSVSLSRQWHRPDLVPDDMRENGSLRSVCHDGENRVIPGDDLELSPPAQ